MNGIVNGTCILGPLDSVVSRRDTYWIAYYKRDRKLETRTSNSRGKANTNEKVATTGKWVLDKKIYFGLRGLAEQGNKELTYNLTRALRIEHIEMSFKFDFTFLDLEIIWKNQKSQIRCFPKFNRIMSFFFKRTYFN